MKKGFTAVFKANLSDAKRLLPLWELHVLQPIVNGEFIAAVAPTGAVILTPARCARSIASTTCTAHKLGLDE